MQICPLTRNTHATPPGDLLLARRRADGSFGPPDPHWFDTPTRYYSKASQAGLASDPVGGEVRTTALGLTAWPSSLVSDVLWLDPTDGRAVHAAAFLDCSNPNCQGRWMNSMGDLEPLCVRS